MRILEEINLPKFRVTVMQWNNKYLVKVESGLLEQTFKIPETDVSGPEEIKEMFTEVWQQQVWARFNDMNNQLQAMLAY